MFKFKPHFKLSKSFENFILHLHPLKIDERAVKFNRTFGLGGICALLFILLCFTGILLRFSYIPTINGAYESIVNLEEHTIFGQFIRNVHILSSRLLIIAAFLHLLRVYYSMSIFDKRTQNWLMGLFLFFLVIAFNFTGYLLPWNQLSYWAVTIFTQLLEYIPFVGKSLASSLRGGETINQTTLIRFYTLHTGVLPLIFLIFMSIHFWLIRKAGGVALPQTSTKTKKVSVNPYLIYKEFMVACILIAAIVLVAIFYKENIGEAANPLKTPNPTKAPWYFMGIQELLLHFHPFFAAFIIPISILAYYIMLPYFHSSHTNYGIWFYSPQGKKSALYSFVYGLLFTFILIYALEHFLHFNIWLKNTPQWIYDGIIPLILYALPTSIFISSLKKRLQLSLSEIFISVTTIMISSYITMLFITYFLRHEGMNLIV